VLVVVALGAVLARALIVLSTVTAAIVVSVVAAAIVVPYVAALRRRGWSRTRAAAGVMGGVIVAAIGIVVVTIVAFLPVAVDIVEALDAGLHRIEETLSGAGLPPEGWDVVAAMTAALRSWLSGAAAALVGAVATAASIAVLALFTTFFLLVDGDEAAARLIEMAPPAKRNLLAAAGRDAIGRVGRFFRSAAIVGGIDALAAFAILVVLGIPLAAGLAVLVFLLGFIPYVGVVIAAAALVLVALATGGPGSAGIVLVLVVVGKIVERRYLGAFIPEADAQVHPAVVLVALPIGATVAGFLGLFVVVPVVAMFIAVNGALIEALDPGPALQRDPLVPGWLDRLAQWSWRILIVTIVGAISVAAIASVPFLFIPALFALFLAATLAPVVRGLLERGVGRPIAAGASTAATFVVVTLVTVLSLVSIVGEARAIAGTGTTGADDVVGGTDLTWLVEIVRAFGSWLVIVASDAVAAVAAIGAAIVLMALLTFLFLRDGAQIWAWFLDRLPTNARAQIGPAGSRASGILSGYMFGTAALAAFGAATQWLTMAIMGIPLALPLAVLSFFGGFIPYIGSAITTGFALLVTIAVGDPTDIAVMLAFTVIFNIVQGSFLAPLVYSRAVDLHPAVVLLSIPAGGAVAGITGMILIVPLLGVVAATWRAVLAAFAPGRDTTSSPGQTEVVARPAPVTVADS
jgi:predicted PurR-regulated permease PerM